MVLPLQLHRRKLIFCRRPKRLAAVLEVNELTVLELYNAALALLNETDTDAKDYPRLKVPYINMVLAQNFTTENWIRRSKNEALLAHIPVVSSDADVLPYDIDFSRECLPYALAAMFAVDEDRDLANVYSRIHSELSDKYLQVFADRIDDVYKEG